MIDDKSSCKTMGSLSVNHYSSVRSDRKDYCREIGLICKHTLYYFHVDPYPTMILNPGVQQTMTNNVYSQNVTMTASNDRTSQKTNLMVNFTYEAKEVGIGTYLGFLLLTILVILAIWAHVFKKKSKGKKTESKCKKIQNQ